MLVRSRSPEAETQDIKDATTTVELDEEQRSV